MYVCMYVCILRITRVEWQNSNTMDSDA